MKMRMTALISGALVASMVLVGCSNSMNGMPGGESSSSADSSPFNDADVDFAMNMVVHHAQAIQMAELLLSKDGVDARVVELAQKIKAAQAPEIDTMNTWLDAWNAGGMEDMDHGMGEAMSDDDMAALAAAPGVDASRLFLEQMTVHHEGAIEMAQTEVDEGENADATTLAAKIISDQTTEIGLMADLLAAL